MEELRRSVGLRGYGQKDPLNEYKSEAFNYFESLIGKIRNDVCIGIFRSASSIEVLQSMIERLQNKMRLSSPASERQNQQPAAHANQGARKEIRLPSVTVEIPKIGRNEMVTITRGGVEQTMKFKKAEPLIRDEGWTLKK